MDFEQRFDCCEACNSITYQCQNNKSPMQTQGQGDCKCNIQVQGNENIWMEKGKKFRSKIVREINDSGSKVEQQKKYLDGHCYCFTKQDFPDKLKRETKVENKDYRIFENANYFWDTPSTNWTPNSEGLFMSEGSKRDNYSNADKLLTENIFEFEEKVDFLFRIFKDFGQKFPIDGYVDQTKATEGIVKDVVHLLDFNKRLCAAEEGIEKLALILEDLVKDSSKKKVDGDTTYVDHLDFDEMSVSQRINYLKSRNDLMLSFMKAFLKAGSSEDTYSRNRSLSNEYELKQMSLDHGENRQTNNLNRVKIMETLRNLRMRMTELRQKKSQHYNEQQKIRNEKKVENSIKYGKNKLEVISEQAELVLGDENENTGEDCRRKNVDRSLLEKLSEINEESDESDLSVPDVTFRILSEESDLFKPFDKLLLSNSTEKKYGKGSNVQILKDKNNEVDVAVNYDTSSEISCIYWDEDKTEKTAERIKSGPPGLYTKKDLKETLKREKNSLEKASKDLCKQNGTLIKKSNGFTEDKIQSARKLLQKNIHTIYPEKGNRSSVTELCSSSRENRKRETSKEQRQRPMTDPSSHRKILPASGLKPLVQEKCTTKISDINNVKNKNKNLLRKKSCVQTS